MNTFEAEYEAAQDAIKSATLINEQNLAGHFNEYSDHDLIKLLASGKKFLRLKDGFGYRVIEQSELHAEIAEDSDFTIKLINETLDGDTSIETVRKLIDDEIYKRISASLDEIKSDYEDLLHGVEL